jgi:hypothetical protein
MPISYLHTPPPKNEQKAYINGNSCFGIDERSTADRDRFTSEFMIGISPSIAEKV